jgi:hypothetical protein
MIIDGHELLEVRPERGATGEVGRPGRMMATIG